MYAELFFKKSVSFFFIFFHFFKIVRLYGRIQGRTYFFNYFLDVSLVRSMNLDRYFTGVVLFITIYLFGSIYLLCIHLFLYLFNILSILRKNIQGDILKKSNFMLKFTVKLKVRETLKLYVYGMR